jgi:hypothetical protein
VTGVGADENDLYFCEEEYSLVRGESEENFSLTLGF